MTPCPLCTANSGIHDFQQTCCRVRYLLALPGLDARRCTLARWRQEHGAEAADETEAALTAEWQQRKHAARRQPSTLTADQRQTNPEGWRPAMIDALRAKSEGMP